jgi:tetratricopeptide (TPR) repeat protein
MDKNDYAASLNSLNHILLYEPNNGQALYLRARAFENVGLYERSIVDFDNAQRVGYKDPQLYYFLAKLEMKAGLGEESFQSFNNFFRDQPSQFAKKELRYENGIAAKMAKEYKACVEDLSFVISEGRDEADAYFNRAICFSELNILKEAKLDFKEAVKLKPQLKDHWYYITYDRIYKNNCKQTEQQFLTIINKEMGKKEYFDAFIDAQLRLKCYPDSKILMVKQLEAMLTQFDLYYDEVIVFYQDYIKKHGADPEMQQKMDQLL